MICLQVGSTAGKPLLRSQGKWSMQGELNAIRPCLAKSFVGQLAVVDLNSPLRSN